MPASAAQVFGPVTVDPGFTTTGEKTLLTMNTTLPAGGKNVIVATVLGFYTGTTFGRFHIRKGATALYSVIPICYIWGASSQGIPFTLIAVDNNPTGNDSYSFTVEITRAGTATGAVHVQAIVIKTDDASWVFNSTAISVASGATSTIISLSTTYPSGSKVLALAVVYAYPPSGYNVINAGNIRLKLVTTVISSNEFATSGYNDTSAAAPHFVVLGNIVSPTASTQTWSVEVYNNTTTSQNVFAVLVTFTVNDGATLDTSLVSLTNGVQVTVGNMSTTLTGDVATIGIAAAVNTGTASVTAFNANDVVLQINNSAATQVANARAWTFDVVNIVGFSGVLPLFRIDTGVTNPSYQIKMTARASGINGEAKILAFVLLAGLQIKRVFGETVRETEGSIFGRGRFRISAESVNLSELGRVARNLVRIPLEAVNLVESMVRARIRVRVIGESERIAEAFRALRNRIRQVLEGLSVSEAIARSRQRFRAIAENVLLSEAILRARRMAKIVGETVRSLESAVRSRVIIRLVSEVVRISEAFNSFGGRVKAVIEGLQLSEDVRWSRSLGRVVPEQIRVSESISKAVRFVKILGETVNLPEAFRAVRSRFRSVSESLRISEVVTHFKGTVRVVGEVLNLGELSRVVRNRFKQVGEAVNIGEVFVRFRVVVKAVLEPISILEVRLVSQSMTRVIGAIVNISETVVRFKGRVLDITERVNVVEFKLFKTIKTYIDRLVSTLRGMAKGGKF
jgi:hypothetical protein